MKRTKRRSKRSLVGKWGRPKRPAYVPSNAFPVFVTGRYRRSGLVVKPVGKPAIVKWLWVPEDLGMEDIVLGRLRFLSAFASWEGKEAPHQSNNGGGDAGDFGGNRAAAAAVVAAVSTEIAT